METKIEKNYISENISDKVQSIIENQNPFKNFKLENYKYAQLHKKLTQKILLTILNIIKILRFYH